VLMGLRLRWRATCGRTSHVGKKARRSDAAKAHLGPAPELLAPGVEEVRVPRALRRAAAPDLAPHVPALDPGHVAAAHLHVAAELVEDALLVRAFPRPPAVLARRAEDHVDAAPLDADGLHEARPAVLRPVLAGAALAALRRGARRADAAADAPRRVGPRGRPPLGHGPAQELGDVGPFDQRLDADPLDRRLDQPLRDAELARAVVVHDVEARVRDLDDRRRVKMVAGVHEALDGVADFEPEVRVVAPAAVAVLGDRVEGRVLLGRRLLLLAALFWGHIDVRRALATRLRLRAAAEGRGSGRRARERVPGTRTLKWLQVRRF